MTEAPETVSAPRASLAPRVRSLSRALGSGLRYIGARAALAWRGGWGAILIITIVGLTLRVLIPALVIWNSPHDDEHFMRMAASILSGDWLGTWGSSPVVPHITLAKGPGYSLFLAGIHWTGLAPHVAGYLLYLLGAALLATGLRTQLGTRWFVALYGLLALNPLVFSSFYSKVYRDQLVASLALLSLGIALQLGRRYVRPDAWSGRRVVGTLTGTLALGLVFGLLLITRDDTIWILFASGGFIGVALLAARSRRSLRMWGGAVVGVLVVGALAVAAPLGVAAMNERVYSVKLENDFSQGSFPDAMALWASVEVEGGAPFQLIGRPQRAAVYRVSPAARVLQSHLEGVESFWIDHSCEYQKDTVVVPCDDYGSRIIWAMRDAAVQTGVSTAAEFQEFFRRIADEIAAACNSGELTCGHGGLFGVLPPLDSLSKRVVVSGFGALADGALNYRTGAQLQTLPSASDEAVPLWVATVNGANAGSALLAAGHHPPVISQVQVVALLTTLYTWLTIPMLLVALVGAFTKRMWTTRHGTLALFSLAGWLANLAIVAVFYAGANRVQDGMSLYTMPSQSYLITGIVLATAAMSKGALSRLGAERVAGDDAL